MQFNNHTALSLNDELKRMNLSISKGGEVNRPKLVVGCGRMSHVPAGP
jgi:hypothetical protein